MTREQHKEHNAKYYHASVLHWLNETTDRAFREFECDRTCDSCLFYDDDCKVCTNDSVFGMDEDLMRTGAFSTLPNFSCNRWEQKK